MPAAWSTCRWRWVASDSESWRKNLHHCKRTCPAETVSARTRNDATTHSSLAWEFPSFRRRDSSSLSLAWPLERAVELFEQHILVPFFSTALASMSRGFGVLEPEQREGLAPRRKQANLFSQFEVNEGILRGPHIGGNSALSPGRSSGHGLYGDTASGYCDARRNPEPHLAHRT
jgi:hypothetical protein